LTDRKVGDKDPQSSLRRNNRETAPMKTGRMKIRGTAEVRVPKTAELVATEIRNAILAGSLRPGDRLPPENALMSTFGVSRPSLREALRLLEAEELLDIRRGAQGGAVVRRPSALPALRATAAWLALGDTDTESLRAATGATSDDSDLVEIAGSALRMALKEVKAQNAA
jgi:DNA-binding FadR family transcriptional regulator